ncbi:M48 family metalloprotease [Novosphingobium olei]|uniref:M48 family metalloprotease n=1 Tax=Novosphingobium olei TaxID=2728851 RepID=A0A7Y0BS98_9SPHN|nr:M48 family metalloprotease [Novosphingobium olei]NML95652.1 M48 family metalloprotease [Novosphingobium olei]
MKILLKTAMALSLAGFAACPAQAQFPNLGSLLNKAQNAKKIGDGLRSISQEEEIKLGGDLAGMILGAAPLIKDDAKQRYVNELGRWLASHCSRPDLPWKFGIIDSPDYNAFSMPGGYVLITRGLFDQMRNESELAGVLAHEIAHVERKDHLNALQRSMREQALGDMQQYFRGPGGIASQFTTALLAAGKDIYTHGLNKGDEFDADRNGVVIAARSGFSPFGLVGVLQTLSGQSDTSGRALHDRTHPLAAERIDRLDLAMGTQFDAMTGVVDDLPSFVALRTPPPPPPPPAQAKPPVRKGKRRG